ncbi:MAG: hypothetical protein JEZ09_01320 [Salinivirgaceae bacterium]|nr:hypothetical protein [Salinivirgaceae bacterium]
MKVVLLAVVILGIGILGMAFNIVFRKKKFPETHVGQNKEMRKKGIVCAQTMDKMEQAKAKKQARFKNVRIMKA